MAEHRRAPVRALAPAAFAALSVAIACLLVTAEAASVSGSLRAGSGEKTAGNSIPDPPGAELPEPDFNRQPDVAKMHAACDVKALGPVGKGIQMDVDDTDAVVAAGTVEGNAFGKGFDDKVKEAAAKVRSEQAEKCKKGITQFVKHMQKMEDKRIKKEGMRMAALEAKQDAIVKKHEILELQQQGFNRAQAEHVAAVEAQRKEASDREAAQRTVRVAAQREKIAKIREEVKAKQEAKLARVKAKREKEFKKDSEERDKQLAQAEVDKDKKRAKKAAAEQQRKQKIKTNNERIRQRVQRRAQKRKLKMDNMRRRQRERIKRRKLRRLEKKAERRERKNLKKQQKKRKRRRKRRIIRRIIRRTNPDGTVSETVTQVPVVDNSTSTEEPPPPPKKKKRKRKRIIKRIVKRWVTKPADPTAASFRTLPDAPPGPPNPAALKILEDMQNAYNNNNNDGKSRKSSEASGDDDEEEETEEESDHLDLLVQMGQHFRELHPSARIHSHRFAPATNGTATDGNTTSNLTAATANTTAANTTAATNATAAANATAATNATGVANATGGSNVTAATGANSTNPSNVTAATNSSTKKPDNDTDDDDKKEVVKPPPPPPPKPPVIPSKISPFDVSKAADALQSIMGPESVPDEKTAKLLAALFANALKLSKIPEPPINKSRPNDIEKMFEKAALGIVDETEKRQEKAIEHATKKRERKEKREEEKKKDEAEEAAFQNIVKRRKALVEKWTELLKLPEFDDPKPMSFYEEARQKMHWLQMTWAFQEQEHKKQLAERDFERAKTKAAEKRLWRQKKQLEELKYMLIVHMNKLGRKPTSIEVPKPAGTPSVKVYQVNTRHASTLLDQEHLTDTSRTMVFPTYALDDRLPVLEADGRDEPVTPIEQLMSIGRMAALDSKETKTAELSEAERLALQFSKGAKVDF